jgi:alpha-amylase
MRALTAPVATVLGVAIAASTLALASPFDQDLDADGRPDHLDNCPLIANPNQFDSDQDADGDACDCAPLVVGISRPPTPVGDSLRIDQTQLSWSGSSPVQLANIYRGTIDGVFAFNDQCWRAAQTTTTVVDLDLPSAGSALYYLVTNVNRCGEAALAHAASHCTLVPSDRDLDSVDDLDDNCVVVANASQLDQDHDFGGDACDACPLDPTNDADNDAVCALTRGPDLAWIDSTVYVLIPHKFENGDPDNDYMKQQYNLPNPAYEGGFLGGDLQGALNRISYLKSLGLNTILIYPPFENDRNEFFGFLPTGYRVVDWRQIDRNFGTKPLFRSFVDQLHQSPTPMRLILDLPIGMAGIEHRWNTQQLDYPFWFRPWGTENVASEPAQTAYGPVDNAFGMPIINHLKGQPTRNETYQALTDEVMIWLSREYGIDGLRYDSVQNFWVDFWSHSINDFRRAIHRVRPDTAHFGEWAWLGPLLSWQRADHEYVNTASATGIRFHGIYDFSIISDIRQVFGRSANPSLLVFNHNARKANFEDPRVLAASIDNYEADSFLKAVTDSNGKARMKLALVFLMTIDRVPFIYSGNEYGIDYEQPGTLFGPGLDGVFHQWFKNLVQIRNSRLVLRRAGVAWLTRNATYLSFARADATGKIISAFHIGAAANRQETLNIGAAGINCSSVSNLLDAADTGNQLNGSGATQTLRITHDPWEPKILLCQ